MLKNSGPNAGKGPMPNVPSPARPNTPPESQKKRDRKIFSPVESREAYSPSALLPSQQRVPTPAPRAKFVPFSVPRTCSACGTYHEGSSPCPVTISPTSPLLDQAKNTDLALIVEKEQPLSVIPQHAIEELTTSPAQCETKFTLYRADTRTYNDLQKNSPEGFTAWVPLNTEQARKFVSIFLGNKDISGLPTHVIENIAKWGGKPKLNDLSVYIKYTKDKSTTWVSTAINTQAGGQSSGAPLYEISMVLNEFKIGREGLEPLRGGRTKNMEPSILLDNLSIETSQIIALNHGPTSDAEVSFLTKIPMTHIKPYTGNR